MHIQHTTQRLVKQLSEVIRSLKPAEYQLPLEVLSGSSVGQHVRHILEFYLQLISGSMAGEINYDLRKRNAELETDPESALDCLMQIELWVLQTSAHTPLILHFSYDAQGNAGGQVTTNIGRELVYNIEHTVHHMALLKIGIRVINQNFIFPENFGIATSTVRHLDYVHREFSSTR